ncbi:PilC/PilY family type IV pilus protein [Acinetobacter gyllenbergii]|uniref:PilC/PilY family type IV pilus protein n=1 Tax=Acinetobacter gyllenbergii TaxID=134534 RepID=UPI000806AA23|nr:PilC/PilY family type IV pilus protein [Acinetobacter gyllenbergii]OBY74289.1 pilus assembly protein PilY [Acinetobacter gyllenbergii]
MNNNKMKTRIKNQSSTELKIKSLLACCSVLSSSLVLSSVASASDIEVYQPADGNKKRIMLMVDQSRSMGGAGLLDLVKDYPLCVGGGVTNVLGKGGLDLGIKVAGETDVSNIVTNILGAVDKNVLQQALGGSLDPLLKVTTEQLSDQYPFPRQYCTVVTTDLVVDTLDGLLKPLLGATGLSAKEYIEQTCDLQMNLDLLKPVTGKSAVGLYRCYDKSSRVRMALLDVLKGNDALGIERIPDSTAVGLSVSPDDHTQNDRAGAIVSEPKLLSTKYIVNGTEKTHREHLIDYISSPKMASQGEFSVGNLLAQNIPKLIGAVLSDVLSKVLNILANPLGAASSLLEFEKTNSELNKLLSVLGLGGNSPLASSYAETGAYLLGTTTKGTGARQLYMRTTTLSLLGIKIGEQQYRCQDWDAKGNCLTNKWQKREFKLFGGGWNWNWDTEEIKQLVKVEGDLVGNLLGDGGLLGAVGNIVGSLAEIGEKDLYYGFVAEQDAEYSGFSNSLKHQNTANVLTQNNNKFYKTPSESPECDANGLIVIAGGVPNISPTITDALLQPNSQTKIGGVEKAIERMMGRSLDQKQAISITYKNGDIREWDFRCNSTELKKTQKGDSDFATWQCIGAYARDIRKLPSNPITTAVIGMDRSFLQLPSQINGRMNEQDTSGLDLINNTTVSEDQLLTGFVPKTVKSLLDTLAIGPLGNGVKSLLNSLFPPSPEDIKNMARWGVVGGGGWYNSANSANISASIKNFHDNLGVVDGDPIGLQALPADPLTPYRMENSVYTSLFEPTYKASWFGNFKKYYVESDNAINKLKDAWDSNSPSYDVKDWHQGGVLGFLRGKARKLYINRGCQKTGDSYQFIATDQLQSIDNHYLDSSNAKRCVLNNSLKDPKGYYLMNLLGYQIAQNATAADLTEINFKNWQIGMNLHSIPVKLTQEATLNADQSIQKRSDYVLFGTTQGVLHVVDAKTGQEKFAFVPNEMLEDSKDPTRIYYKGLQREAFMHTRKGVREQMPYGVDGAWTVYSEYAYGIEPGSSGSISRNVIATVGTIKSNGQIIAKGQQIAYGGLRMGGRSYYALDLVDLDAPKLKFHIDPDNADNASPLSYMGQSWSKPTITYVKWNGLRKRVMLVGGGYDMGYEKTDYSPSFAKGAGVYMFDADNGDLLWWASAKAVPAQNGLKIDNMKYSVVSRIAVADRDGDSLTDHLYFGDLGGQVWRIDFDANLGKKETSNQVNMGGYSLLFSNTADRFYEAPSFSVYGYEQPIAVVSIASGNRSLPWSDRTSSSRIYNLFDQDVVKPNFTINQNNSAKIVLSDLKNMAKADQIKGKTLAEVKASMSSGWSTLAVNVAGLEVKDGKEGLIQDSRGSKVLGEMVVMNKSLYASVYNPNDTLGKGCSVQAKGLTTVQRYCLPFGVCEQNINENTIMSFGAGHGIVDSMVGSGVATKDNGLVRQLLNTSAKDKIGNGVMSVNQMRRHLVPLKWYEDSE